MFQCPKCKRDNLVIEHRVLHITYVDRTEEVGDSEPQDLEWDEHDAARCNDCDWIGTVGGMSIEEEVDDEQQEEDYANDPRT